MNKVQRKRMNNLVQVLRDAAKDKRLCRLFTMGRFGYSEDDCDNSPEDVNICGTPACALGHYAVRRDVQRTFALTNDGNEVMVGKAPVNYDYHMTEHFGITEGQVDELFGGYGCENAKTPTQAANYIEKFIRRITP